MRALEFPAGEQLTTLAEVVEVVEVHCGTVQPMSLRLEALEVQVEEAPARKGLQQALLEPRIRVAVAEAVDWRQMEMAQVEQEDLELLLCDTRHIR